MPDGSDAALPPRPVLAAGRVRMVGDPVAFVVAESAAEARAAAEAVTVAYRPLPSVTEATAALDADTPALHDEAPGNLCLDWELGDREAAEEALERSRPSGEHGDPQPAGQRLPDGAPGRTRQLRSR